MAVLTVADVYEAAARIRGVAYRTPLLSSPALDAATGGRVFVKPEVLQRTGSFKFRGAYNRLSALSPSERQGGVVACSSGNHAQGVACAAALLGMPAVIVMPADAPAIKVANTRGYGAEVVLYDRTRENREEIAGRIAAERGSVFVPPYDDPYIIAGQGTAGREIADDCAELGVSPDVVLVCTSGGGFVAGVALAVKERFPQAEIYTAEPAGFDDHARSFASGRRERNPALSGSLCDALLAPTPGQITFEINSQLVGRGVAASDDEVKAAMAFAFRELKLVVEPGGAVALAALLAGRPKLNGRTAVIVLSGGNVDPELFSGVVRA